VWRKSKRIRLADGYGGLIADEFSGIGSLIDSHEIH